MDRRVVLVVALGVHLTVALAHGSTHALVPVGLPAWQNLLVLATTFLGRFALVGFLGRLFRGGFGRGVPLFAASMAGALLVGGTLHFLVDNPDNVRAIPADPWRLPFRISAVAVAATAGTGAAVGAWAWRTR